MPTNPRGGYPYRVLRGLTKAALRPTVQQLIRDLVADEFEGEELVNEVSCRMLRKIGNMPPHLGVGMAALTLAFEASGPVWHRLPAESRKKRFEAWRGTPVLQDWVTFWEKMGIFVYWSVVEEREQA